MPFFLPWGRWGLCWLGLGSSCCFGFGGHPSTLWPVRSLPVLRREQARRRRPLPPAAPTSALKAHIPQKDPEPRLRGPQHLLRSGDGPGDARCPSRTVSWSSRPCRGPRLGRAQGLRALAATAELKPAKRGSRGSTSQGLRLSLRLRLWLQGGREGWLERPGVALSHSAPSLSVLFLHPEAVQARCSTV